MNTHPLCDFDRCPKNATCKHFRWVIDKTKNLWWAIYPYHILKGRCYTPKDKPTSKDIINQ